MAWLNPGRWLAVIAFIFSLYLLHYFDKQSAVKEAVGKVVSEHNQQMVVQNALNQAKTKALEQSVTRLKNDYAKQKNIDAELSRLAADRLRDYQSALSAASSNTEPASGISSPFARIAGECANALATLDEYSRGIRTTAGALQDYAKLHLK